MEAASRREGVDTKALPVLLRSLLAAPAASSPLSLGYNTDSWTELLAACGGSQLKDEDSAATVVFAQKVEEILKSSDLDSPTTPPQSAVAGKTNLRSIAKATQPWQRTRGEYKEEETVLFNEEVDKKPGYRCDNKAVVQISSTFDFGDGGPGTSFTQTQGAEWMDAAADDHSAWQRRRLQILKRRMIANVTPTAQGLQSDAPMSSPIKGQQIVQIGELAGGEGRPFSFVSMVLDDVTRNKEPIQLLYTEETLARQHRQLKGDGQRRCSDPATSGDEEASPCVSVGGEKQKRGGQEGRTEELCAYPGMLVAACGVLSQTEFGAKLSVSSLHGGPALPAPTYRQVLTVPAAPAGRDSNRGDGEARTVASCYRRQPVHIMLACAQALVSMKADTVSRNLELDLLLDRVREEAPHALILFGPIVPSSALVSMSVSAPAALATLPDVDWIYTSFFRQVASRLAGTRTRVFVVPSPADVVHPHPLPQPPYAPDLISSDPFTGLSAAARQQISFLPNPCFLYVNELRLLITSVDPLMEVGGQLAYPRCISSRQDLITTCCASLLRQRTLFPSGASFTLPMDPKRFPPRMFDAGENGEDTIPHIVIFPSDANASGDAGSSSNGTYACMAEGRLFVLPFSPRLVRENSGRVEWTSIYVQPPTEEEHTDESRGAEIQDNAYDALAGERKVEGRAEPQLLCLEKRVTVRHSSYGLA
ncbi:DNA polymerase epsilon subunit B protein [Besnoitia besnoiti]|uniref:DNA polymerase alpha subunit B n=1 Tax=Besnoitia besnoiti TaxID=94643 RepID=A0A2A9MGD8_BESBE|nr:DNA polymerase epsilon subunit B protein [Besnoitia besnoiti]PFH34470.1 DNA polymerase epsilon subunit B protein [Besnoitia besnoiti]